MNEDKIKVMVVEDEVLIGLMLVKKLRSYGYEVGEVVTTGEEAVEKTAAESPAVILMDVTLAGPMNGIEAAQKIKDRYNIPIIIFTGYDDRQLYDQARRVDPVAILAKMVPMSDIVAAIAKATGC